MEYKITLTATGVCTCYSEAQKFFALQYIASLASDGIAFTFAKGKK